MSENIDLKQWISSNWGWENPTNELIEHAIKAFERKQSQTPLLDALIEYQVFNAEAIEHVKELLLSDKGSIYNQYKLLLEEYNQNSMLAEHKNKILSECRGEQFLPDPGKLLLNVHELMQDPRIFAFCKENQCCLMKQEQSRPLLLIGEYSLIRDNLTSLVGASRSQHPIMGKFEQVYFAFSKMDLVNDLLTRVSDPEATREAQNVIHEAELRGRDNRAREKLASIIDHAVRNGGTDIHINPNHYDPICPIHFRRHTVLHPIPRQHWFTLPEYQEVKRLLLEKSSAAPSGAEVMTPVDGGFIYLRVSSSQVKCRASFIPLGHEMTVSESLVGIRLRLMLQGRGAPEAINAVEIGHHAESIQHLKDAIAMQSGMVIMIGPTNSGKSTTCLSMVELNRQLFGDKISRVSIEDPVERIVPGIEQYQINHTLRNDPDRFVKYLTSLVRFDPDFIFLGEIRDPKTAAMGVESAMTGHLVLATLHADNTYLGMKRLLNMLPDSDKQFMAIHSVHHLFSQRLYPKVCSHCAIEREVTDWDARQLHFRWRDTVSNIKDIPLPLTAKDIKAGGCHECDFIGTNGVHPILEYLPLNNEAKSMLLSDSHAEFEALKDKRKQDLYRELIRAVASGIVPLSSVIADQGVMNDADAK